MSAAAMPVCLSGTTPQPATEEVAVTRMTVRGTRVWMAYRPDRREWRRRQACGLGPVLAWDLLDTLMDFPAGMAVPAAAWTARCGGGSPPPRRRRALRRGRGDPHHRARGDATAGGHHRPGLAGGAGGSVTVRKLLSPLGRRAGPGGVHCGGPGSCAAARGGPGRGRAGQARVLAEPAPVPGWEPTPAWWRFCEEIYGQAAGAEA